MTPTTTVDRALPAHAAELELPAMLLHDAAVDHNIAVMAQWCATHGVELAPHAKTHMCTELARRQLDAGAWALTVATPAQLRVLATDGVPRILHANLLVDPSAIGFVRDELLPSGRTDYLCYVDSEESVALLADAFAEADRPLQVLVEVGFPGGRTGVRDTESGRRVVDAVSRAAGLRLAGVSCFEGLMPGMAGDPRAGFATLAARVHQVLDYAVATHVAPELPIVTAGGSSYFDVVVDALGPAAWPYPVRTVLRSGCYLTHDHGTYRESSPLGELRGTGQLRPAFELRARVLSTPEPGLAIVGFGRREAPTDDRLPIPLGRLSDAPGHSDVAGWSVTAVNDHHAFLHLPDDTRLTVGEVLRFGISHPCGAFDRWRTIPLVSPEGEIQGAVEPRL